MDRIERKVSALYTVFSIFCSVLLFSAYLITIWLAFKADITPILGVMIITLPPLSYVVASVVSDSQKANAKFPRVFITHDTIEHEKVLLPMGWRFEKQHNLFLAIDEHESIRIVSMQINENEKLTEPRLFYAGNVISFPRISFWGNREDILRCTYQIGTRRIHGFTGEVLSTKDQRYRVFFIDANKQDLFTISEILCNYSYAIGDDNLS